MTLRKVLLSIGGCVLGAAAVALPAAAGSEGAPTIEALSHGSGVYGESHEWAPNEATVAVGGSVNVANKGSTVPHGVEWVAGPGGAVPACSGVPGTSGQPRSGTSWSGSCSFSEPGTYVFYCTVHGPEMTGTITVTSAGTSTTSPGTPPPAPGAPGSGSQGGAGPEPPSGSPASPLAGDAAAAVKLAGAQRGRVVRGSVAVSHGGRRRAPRGGTARRPRHPLESLDGSHGARRAQRVLAPASGAAVKIARSVHLHG